MKKILAWVLALTMVAAGSVGATLAYLVNTDEDVNVMTLGKVLIDQLEYERTDTEAEGEDADIQKFRHDKPLFPGVYDETFDFSDPEGLVHWDSIGKDGYTSEIWNPEAVNNEQDKMVFVRNKGTRDAYVRTVFAFEASPDWSFGEFRELIHLNSNTTDWTWTWVETPVTVGEGTYYVAVATYDHILPPSAISAISLSQVLMDKTVTNADLQKLGDTYTILVNSQAVQAEGFTDPETALNESFGLISAANTPFVNDRPAAAVDMKSAFRFLNADGVTDISQQVQKVVFGYEKDHPETLLQNNGIQVQTAQGANAYAYYEKDDAGLYTVYILSSDPVYAPADSTGLFEKMSALTTVDTSNLDVSQVEVMDRMFYQCEKLQSVDVSRWDTSNVKTTNDMFFRCIKVNGLDVSNWDVSNVTSMSGMFDLFGKSQTTTALTYLDVSKWDVSNVTDMSRLFLGCNKLSGLVLKDWDVSNVTNMYRTLGNLYSQEYFDIEDWDVSSCTTLEDTFVNAEKIKTLDLSKWNVSNVTNMQGTFTSFLVCTELNLTGWDTSKVTNMLQTFWNCRSMVSIPGLSEFDTSNVTTFQGMFGNCAKNGQNLHLDLSKWDTSSVTNMRQMFYYSDALTVEGLENWNVSSLKNTYAMFYYAKAITELDLSGWQPTKLTDARYMFGGCSNLQTIYASDLWTNASITSSGSMFSGCSKLVGGAGTKVSGTNATNARIDIPAVKDEAGNVITPAVPGYLTHINDKPVTE